jgi:hypothetical protein
MAIKFAKKPAAGGTTKKMPSGTEVTSNEEVKVPKTVAPKTAAEPPDGETQYARIGLEGSYTHNLGDYKSAKVGCWIEVPAATDEIEEVYDWAKKWVEAKMALLIEEVTAG